MSSVVTDPVLSGLILSCLVWSSLGVKLGDGKSKFRVWRILG